jgi:tetratricopeptide (TPR) repeat protein
LEEEMHRSFRALAGCLLLVLLTASAALAQDWRGSGRADGFIKDQDGKPIEGVTVKVTLVRVGSGPKPTTTNKGGYWGFGGMAGGQWEIEVTAPGYESIKTTFSVSEGQMFHAGDRRLQKAAPVAPAAPELDAAAKAGQEAVAAVTEGNRLVGEKKYAEARAQYEKAIALLPPNAALLKGVAQTYHGEGNDAKAVETLRKVVELDPADTDTKLLLASMLVQQGQADEGKALLESLPAGTVKDSAVYFNLAITFMNKKKPEDAAAYFTKAIELDPASADAYFYRGMAEFQTKKNAEAKADFKKYLELDPNGAEAKDAKEMLQALK